MRFDSVPAWGWLVATFAVLYSINLGVAELTPIDEARTAVIAREMVNGAVLYPRTPDGVLSEKPPVYYGLSAAAFSIFGEKEWPLRGVSALMAAATLLVVGWTASSLGNPRAALLAVGLLGSNLIFASWARIAMVDMTFTFFLTAGLAPYLAARMGKLSPSRASMLAGVAFGLAVLAKGPLGLAIPIGAATIDLIVTTRGRIWTAGPSLAAAAGAIALATGVALAWYLPGFIAGGNEFLHTSLLDENLYMPLGIRHGIAGSHAKSMGYYPTRLLLVWLPVVALLPEALRRLPGRFRESSVAVLVTWVAAGLLILVAATNKRMHYLLPLQPAIALLLALALDSIADNRASGTLRWSVRMAGILLAVGALAFAAMTFATPSPGISDETRELFDILRKHRGRLAVAGIVFSWVGILMAAASWASTRAMFRSVLVAAALTVVVRPFLLDPIQGRLDRVRPFVAEMMKRVPPGARVTWCPPEYGYSIDFYWPDPIDRDSKTLAAGDLAFVRRSRIPQLPGPVEVLGVVEFSSHARDIALVRRLYSDR